MTEKKAPDLVVQLAVKYHDYKWPKSLPSGVMFYLGHKVTIDEFNAWAKKFK